MEDVGIPIHNELLKQMRVRDEVNGDNRDDEKRQKIDDEEGGEEEEAISTTPEGGVDVGGGLMDSLLAKLTSPRGASNGKDSQVFKDDVEGETEGGGGVISDIISGLFSKGGGEGENGSKNDDGGEDVGLDGGSSKINGGSIISNLVPDEAPAADEASILIHSVVHD